LERGTRHRFGFLSASEIESDDKSSHSKICMPIPYCDLAPALLQSFHRANCFVLQSATMSPMATEPEAR
jgi:Rad3-related DNA helicase